MVLKYFDYTIESKMDEILILINRINESKDNDEDEGELEGKFDEFLRIAFSKGAQIGISIASYFYNLIKRNKKVALLIFSLLILKYGISESEILKNFSLSTSDKEYVKGISAQNSKDLVSKGNVDDLLNAIAKRESSNDPGVVNRLGYIGLYQFGRGALTDLKIYSDVDKKIILTSKAFLQNPDLFTVEEQNKAMLKYLRINRRYLKKEIEQYVGKTIGGIKITESGLLAGSHLLGHGGIKDFLKSNGKNIPKDGNGTPITEYIEKFGGYDLDDLEDRKLASVENINPKWKKDSKFKAWKNTGKNKSPNQ